LKFVNDNQKHAVGNQLTIRAANAIQDVVRLIDITTRVGGDEFLILCIECPLDKARVFIEHLRHHFDKADAKMYEEKRRKQNAIASNNH